jgi:hypothetical protein
MLILLWGNIFAIQQTIIESLIQNYDKRVRSVNRLDFLDWKVA